VAFPETNRTAPNDLVGMSSADVEALLLFPPESQAAVPDVQASPRPRIAFETIKPTFISGYPPPPMPNGSPKWLMTVRQRVDASRPPYEAPFRPSITEAFRRAPGAAWLRSAAAFCRRPKLVPRSRRWALLVIVGASGVVLGMGLRTVDRPRPLPIRADAAQSRPVDGIPPATGASAPRGDTEVVEANERSESVRRLQLVTAPIERGPRPTAGPPRVPGSVATRFTGRLVINSEPSGATVLINQKPVGITPVELPSYPASSYAVWVQHDGYELWTAGVRVPADKVTRVTAHLRKEP
jgi:hypothetical protein